MAARLTVEQYDQIVYLLMEGRLSQRGIGCLMGCNRGTVGAIALGRRKREMRPGGRSSSEALLEFEPGPAFRCSGCGALVYGDCVACHVHDRLAEGPVSHAEAVNSNGCDGLGLNLDGDCRERYEKIRYRPKHNGREDYGDECLTFGDEGGRSVRDGSVKEFPTSKFLAE